MPLSTHLGNAGAELLADVGAPLAPQVKVRPQLLDHLITGERTP
jgi:hypothetical protein